ncbi:hypothetical protein N7457_007969 [Penicillium paradoxum]|uniref:uncharacterized protein n=1 Tax=Penicillium paradoxum TaxID=176176 RepID=UPI002548959B|nr:uncharacterized protein N7457_007969 [Penicillium paradoxum]KAJ5773073.1 hypothetical protein N7457_007969 [Penicillium paradoxum]
MHSGVWFIIRTLNLQAIHRNTSFVSIFEMAFLNRGRSDSKRLSFRKKGRLHNADLSEPRPRPLTPPLPEDTDSKPQAPSGSRRWRLSLSKWREQRHTFEQAQSPLFAYLPAEVRLLIWEHYFCSHLLHIIRPNQRKWKRSEDLIIGILCTENHGLCPCSHSCWGYAGRRPAGNCVATTQHESYYHKDSEWASDSRRVDFVPLLQTCRKLYSEAIDMIYQKNTFLFNHTYTIIDFSHTLLSQRVSLIRTVQLSFPDHGGPTWDICCQVLATKMPHLKRLTIHLYPHVTNHLDDWLIPLHEIRQPTDFEVLLIKPWYLDPQWEKSLGLVDAPFRFAIVDLDKRIFLHPGLPFEDSTHI